MTESPPYSGLTPDTIIAALESCGFQPDGSMLALNSYENRVYQVGLEDGAFLVAKFYRPERWSDAAIREEHAFSLALAAEEIPVVAPLANAEGNTLHSYDGYRFSLSPRQGGRWPDLDDPDDLMWVGRLMARIHQLGASQPFQDRPTLDPGEMGAASATWLLDNDFIPLELESGYRSITTELQTAIEAGFEQVGGYQQIRLHGDCHPGTILWTDGGPHFVDLDDCRNGPAIQDLWMLLSGEANEMSMQLSYLREGYEMFASNGILFNHEGPTRGETFVTRKISRGVAAIELGLDDKIHLGNLDAARDWGDARDFVEGMWLMLQQDTPENFVLATGESHTVREFAENAFAALDISIAWQGTGVDEKGVDNATGDTIIQVDPRYFRPTEVDFLCGDASKAREKLGWSPKILFPQLVADMVASDYEYFKAPPEENA